MRSTWREGDGVSMEIEAREISGGRLSWEEGEGGIPRAAWGLNGATGESSIGLEASVEFVLMMEMKKAAQSKYLEASRTRSISGSGNPPEVEPRSVSQTSQWLLIFPGKLSQGRGRFCTDRGPLIWRWGPPGHAWKQRITISCTGSNSPQINYQLNYMIKTFNLFYFNASKF